MRKAKLWAKRWAAGSFFAEHGFLLQDKPARERGAYLNPGAYGQPDERSVEWARTPNGKKLNSRESRANRESPINKTACVNSILGKEQRP